MSDQPPYPFLPHTEPTMFDEIPLPADYLVARLGRDMVTTDDILEMVDKIDDISFKLVRHGASPNFASTNSTILMAELVYAVHELAYCINVPLTNIVHAVHRARTNSLTHNSSSERVGSDVVEQIVRDHHNAMKGDA